MKNIKINNITVSELLKRGIRVTLAGATLAFTLAMGGCAESNQVAEKEVVVVTPDVVPEEIEPEVVPIKEEPEIVEPVEINPRDYKAVYGFDFDIPIYTDEEVAAANERLQENYECLEKIGRMNEILERDDAFYDEYKIYSNKIKDDYYISRQEDVYKIYASLINVEHSKIVNDNYRKYFYDNNSGFLYIFDKGSVRVMGKCSDDKMIYCYVANCSSINDPVGERSGLNMISIGPGSWVYMGDDENISNKYNEEYQVYEDYSKNYPQGILDEEIIKKYGVVLIESNNNQTYQIK